MQNSRHSEVLMIVFFFYVLVESFLILSVNDSIFFLLGFGEKFFDSECNDSIFFAKFLL